MERQKRGGAVAVKFQTVYVRTLDISNPSMGQARRVYDRYVKGGKGDIPFPHTIGNPLHRKLRTANPKVKEVGSKSTRNPTIRQLNSRFEFKL
jgi:broad specificity phosphatase PhoE